MDNFIQILSFIFSIFSPRDRRARKAKMYFASSGHFNYRINAYTCNSTKFKQSFGEKRTKLLLGELVIKPMDSERLFVLNEAV